MGPKLFICCIVQHFGIDEICDIFQTLGISLIDKDRLNTNENMSESSYEQVFKIHAVMLTGPQAL